MVSILVVEDNEKLRRLMVLHLKRAGYATLEAANGEEALNVMDENNVHLIIADVMMPVMDGYELANELRASGYDLPIIFATAKETLDDKRRGFASGIDDYMVKPIDMEEMLLRIEALLRRANINSKMLMKVGECTLDEGGLTVTKGDKTITLRQKEFLMLQKLLSNPGRIFTRQMLMDEIWGYRSETDPRTVDVHMKRLREKLEGISDFELITVRGLGYKAEVLK